MRSTDKFNEALKEHFNAVCGAYTAITLEEINKQTFNVKAIIRNMLIDKIGRKNIPAHGAQNTKMTFCLADDLATEFGETKDIPCKFSKPNKDEMTIYFSNQDFIQKSSLSANDYWCIFFKENDIRPWFGFLNFSIMNDIQQTYVGEVVLEDDECVEDSKKEIIPLIYNYDINSMEIIKSEAPAVSNLLSKALTRGRAGSRTISTNNMNRILNNKKIKGMRGEEIIIRVEKEKLTKLNRSDLAENVEWKAKQVDGLGYDIESYETDADGKNEHKIFIEVKSTSENKFSPFFISQNEVDVSKEKGNDYYIYRVYDLNPNSNKVSYYRIRGSIENNFELVPQTYIAKLK